MEYNDYIVEGILATNQFMITEVNDLLSLKTIFFVQSEYAEIEILIKKGDLKGIKAFREDQPRIEQYLDIIMFNDQNGKQYIVTIFDSNTLEQDPQVIEVYPL